MRHSGFGVAPVRLTIIHYQGHWGPGCRTSVQCMLVCTTSMSSPSRSGVENKAVEVAGFYKHKLALIDEIVSLFQ